MKNRIVVVGGGSGGTIVANRLADKLGPEIDDGDLEIMVINETADQIYKPLTLYIPFGKNEASQAKRPIRQLLSFRVDFIQDRATNLDPESGEIRLGSGRKISYDYLVLATGSKLAPERTPGLSQAGHQFYDIPGSEKLRDEMASFTGGKLVVSVIGEPHMCPVAPLEFSFLSDN